MVDARRASEDRTASPSWHALRTQRALSRVRIASVVVRDAPALADALDGARRPTWLLRAGAIPLAFPRLPPSSATGRSLAVFGATDGDAQWTSLLARTGGDL
ncbi:MAG: hypothetical protein QOI41_6188, partial [Myxococcales bacterium]|nr:hypothetical protein [Myxococcales bacterium]